MKRIVRFIICLSMMTTCGQVNARITEAEHAQIKEIQETIRAGGKLYVDKNYENSGKKVRRAQMMYQKLSRTGDDDVMKELEPSRRRLEKARELLAKQGVSLPALREFTKPEEKEEEEEEGVAEYEDERFGGEGPGRRIPLPTERNEDAPTRDDPDRRVPLPTERGEDEAIEPERQIPDPVPDSGERQENLPEFERDLLGEDRVVAQPKKISFIRQVLPILAGKCATCHIKDSKGKFSMVSYAEMMKGPPDGPVIIRNKPDKSKFVSLVESGKMPPKGDAVSTEDVKLLTDWVQQGAPFDGRGQSRDLTTLLIDAKNQPEVEEVQAAPIDDRLIRDRREIDMRDEERDSRREMTTDSSREPVRRVEPRPRELIDDDK